MDTALSVFGKTLIGILAVGVIVSVFLRYVFSIAFVWSEELLIIVFVATTFFGAALGLREDEHINICFFLESFPDKIQKFLRVFIYLVIICVSSFVFYYSIILIQKTGSVPSPASGIVRGVYYAILPISFALTVVYSIFAVIGQFIPLAEPDKGYKDDDELFETLENGES